MDNQSEKSIAIEATIVATPYVLCEYCMFCYDVTFSDAITFAKLKKNE